jgi:hypothetical protein
MLIEALKFVGGTDIGRETLGEGVALLAVDSSYIQENGEHLRKLDYENRSLRYIRTVIS